MSRRMLQHRYPRGRPAEAHQPAAATPPTTTEVMPQQWDGAYQPAQYPVAAHLQQPQEGWSVAASAGTAVHGGGPVSGEGHWNAHHQQPLGEEVVVTGGGAVQQQQPWSQEAAPSWPPEGVVAPAPAGVGGQQQCLPPTSWEGGQWAPEQQAYGHWQWQVGTAAEGWAAPANDHWPGAAQGDPSQPPLYPEQAPLYHHGLQQDRDGWEASVEDAVVSSTPPAPECPQDQGGGELPQPSGDVDGTVSMFFQEDCQREPASEPPSPAPQVVEDLSTSTGFAVDGREGGIEASPPPAPPGSDEPINQEVLPEPVLLAAGPREVAPPSQEEGGPECSAPALSKKAVIRARQGGAFKPPARQGSISDSVLLLQQQQQQNGNAPENLELLPPDGGRPSLRRTGSSAAPLSSEPGAVDSVGAALTLLDAPDMQPLVTLAPAAPPIDWHSSRQGASVSGEAAPRQPAAAAPSLLRQSPLGREGEVAAALPTSSATAPVVLASGPVLSEPVLSERSTDRSPQPAVAATRAVAEDPESLPAVRTSAPAASHPSPHHEPTSGGALAPGSRQQHRGAPPIDRGEQPRVSRPARGPHSGDDDEDGAGLDRDGRCPAKGREESQRRRDRHHDRLASKPGDPEECRKRGGAPEERRRRDYDHGWRDDYYEDRRGDRREEFRDDYRKGERRGERHSSRWEPLRGHESDDEWREHRSDRKGDRYRGARPGYRYDDWHGDRYSERARPSSRVSQDGRGDQRRHSESDSSSPDSRKGYPARQKRPGSAGGHSYSAYQRDYYNYYHRYGMAPGTMYGIAPGSGFGYGYHDELYRTNPAYKQQVDAYYSRLGGHPAQLADRRSMHSGRSSARDESFASNTEDDCDPSILDTESTRLDHVVPEPVHKFSRPHPLARFCGASGLLKLVPAVSGESLPPPIELHSLKHLFQKDPHFHQLQAFPGPLVRSDTHKNDVIHFCLHKIESSSAQPSLPDRSSHVLLWELLVLMLRQNGFVSGSDIAELLLRGRGDGATPETRPGGAGGEANSPDSPSPDEGIVVTDRAQLGATGSSRALAKFREFLLFGHKKDALDWAVKCGLWGHALSLAAKMDTRTYAGIMTCFTNALAINDPLQTLYQHLSGRQPAAVTCIADAKWGDWRPHLAMILSNPSSRPEVDARSITTLGDVLASRGCLPAAHFCYLMSQVEFGSYACRAAKLVLLGSNHQALPFQEFASTEAIQCTEIYEYSQSLASPDYMLPHLKVYKFLHAMRLAEYGFAQKALHYCEVLADALVRQGAATQLAAQTYELADRLKYHDPHFSQGQGELEELADPAWLQALAQLLFARHHWHDQGSSGVLPGQLAEGPSSDGVAPQGCAGGEPPSPGHNVGVGGAQAALEQCEDRWQLHSSGPLPGGSARSGQGGFSGPPSTPFPSAEAGWNLQQAPPAATAGGSSYQRPAPESASPVANGVPPQVPPAPPVSSQASSFDYYKASTYTQQQQHQRGKAFRERASSVSSSTDTRRDSVDSAGLTSSASTEPRAAKPAKQPPAAVAGKSWLGGIFGKLLPKGPNQMILPDDKDPDIVWDEQKKCWVDKNAAPGDLENRIAAPPSDSILGAKPSPISNRSGAENRFQLNKQRSLRKHYVDVLNPGASKGVDPLPVAAPFPEQAPPHLFVPTVTEPRGADSSYDFVSSVPPAEQQAHHPGEPPAAPVMYDPAEFSAARPADGHEVAGYHGRRWTPAAYPT